MKMHSTEAMIRRLEVLERHRKRSLWSGAAIGAAALGILWGGTSLTIARRSVEAEQFLLRDKEHTVRAQLGLQTDGAPAFTLFDQRGKARIQLQSTLDDTASLDFYHRGRIQVSLLATSQGLTSLSFYDSRGRTYSGLYVWPDGTAGLSLLRDRRGVQVAAQPDGLTGLTITDREGRTIARVGLPEGVDAKAFLNGQSGPPFQRTKTDSPTTSAAGKHPVPVPRVSTQVLNPIDVVK
jgi:hypothetical protein